MARTGATHCTASPTAPPPRTPHRRTRDPPPLGSPSRTSKVRRSPTAAAGTARPLNQRPARLTAALGHTSNLATLHDPDRPAAARPVHNRLHTTAASPPRRPDGCPHKPPRTLRRPAAGHREPTHHSSRRPALSPRSPTRRAAHPHSGATSARPGPTSACQKLGLRSLALDHAHPSRTKPQADHPSSADHSATPSSNRSGHLARSPHVGSSDTPAESAPLQLTTLLHERRRRVVDRRVAHSRDGTSGAEARTPTAGSMKRGRRSPRQRTRAVQCPCPAKADTAPAPSLEA